MKEETKNGRDVMLLHSGGHYLCLSSFTAFFLFPFLLFVPNFKTSFLSPFALIFLFPFIPPFSNLRSGPI